MLEESWRLRLLQDLAMEYTETHKYMSIIEKRYIVQNILLLLLLYFFNENINVDLLVRNEMVLEQGIGY